jgi:hypothetical protein
MEDETKTAERETMSRVYTAPDGNKYPLTESPWDMMFKVYKSDRRKATSGDPGNCLLARGIRRHKDVLDVYIGSGLDAYVLFKKTDEMPAHAVHFTIRTKVRRVIDKFDADKKSESQTIVLSRPTKSRTLEGRSKLGTRRRHEVKNGALVKKRGPQVAPRIRRLGVHPRPHAPVSKGGSVNVAEA